MGETIRLSDDDREALERLTVELRARNRLPRDNLPHRELAIRYLVRQESKRLGLT